MARPYYPHEIDTHADRGRIEATLEALREELEGTEEEQTEKINTAVEEAEAPLKEELEGLKEQLNEQETATKAAEKERDALFSMIEDLGLGLLRESPTHVRGALERIAACLKEERVLNAVEEAELLGHSDFLAGDV